MRPYCRREWPHSARPFLRYLLVVTIVISIGITSAGTAPGQETDAESGRPSAHQGEKSTEIKELTGSGLQHYYSMEYDAAEQDFRSALKLAPENTATINHLLNTLLFAQLNHSGALNTSLYASDKFLALKNKANIDPEAGAEIKKLAGHALELTNKQLAARPNDETALYERGVTRGLFATYEALVEHAWFAALRSAMAARRDHQRVLELDPKNQDAKFIVGTHTYIAGSLPWAVKVAASMVGFTGNKERGLKLLREAADASGESSVDAKVTLALFLRREQRYQDALKIVQSLTTDYPKNFLFALEEANLLKDMGNNQGALDSFENLIADGHAGRFYEPRLEFAYYGLGEMFRGRKQYTEAADAFDNALKLPRLDADIRQRCALGAGEMHDVLNDRAGAIKEYQLAVAGDSSTPTAHLARRYLQEPYQPQ